MILEGPQLVITLANPMALRVWGREDASELVGRPVCEALPEMSGQGREEMLRAVRETGRPYVGREVPVLVRQPENGVAEPRYIDFVCEPLRTDEGATGDLLTWSTDVTERVHLRQRATEAAEKLRASEDRLRRLTEAALIGTWAMDLDTRMVHADPQLYPAFGLSPPGPHPWDECLAGILAEDRERISNRIEAALSGEGPRVIVDEFRALGSAGEVRWLEGRGKADVDDRGQVVRFIGTVVDITARKHAELERERLLREAARTRERLYAQIMQAPVAVAVGSGPDHVLELANPRYLELFGRTADVIGKPLRAAYPELPDDAPEFEFPEQVYATGVPFSADEYSTSIVRGGRREELYLQFSCQPITDETGAVTDLVMVAIDATARIQARRRSEALMKELQLADQRKDEFLATLAHELRNPMAAISTALQLLEHIEDDPPRARKYRETAQRQMIHLVRIVDDLLDVARITRGKVELRKVEVDLAVIVREALAATRSVIEARGHELTTIVAPGAFRLVADATRLEQVVVNLLTNAAKYTDPGGQITVRLGRERTGDGELAVLSVRDTGRGIPPELIDRVFDLFMQVSPTLDRRTGGLGLGLTLVKRLVEMHGGSVAVASEGAGRGSEFTIRLPLDDPRPPEVLAPVPGASAPRKRVVIVEDSADVREMMQDLLESLGHEVFAAADGLEGVARVLELQPDVALIDVGLPHLDGYEVARQVRAAPEGKRVHLVAVTGYGGPEVTAKALAAGFDLHLTKPVGAAALVAVLGRAAP